MSTVKNISRGTISIGKFGRLLPGETAEVPEDQLRHVCGGGIAEVGPDGHVIDPQLLRERRREAAKPKQPAK